MTSNPAPMGLGLRRALGAYPTGVAVVTAHGPRGRVGITINSFSSVSLDPPLILFSVAASAPSLAVLSEAAHYAVNVLAAGQRDLAARFARPQIDKFDGISWRPGAGQAPLLAGCTAHFQCASYASYPGGDHTIVLGQVLAYSAIPLAPLVFHAGAFGSLEQVLSAEIAPWGVPAS